MVATKSNRNLYFGVIGIPDKQLHQTPLASVFDGLASKEAWKALPL